MGLDSYVYIRRPNEKGEGLSTGACSGLFGIAPDIGNGTEIGYWRKFYTLDKYLGHSEDEFELTREDIVKALDFVKEHLKAFNEGKDLNYSEFEEKYGFEPEDDWQIYKWEDAIEIFVKALKYIDEENAKVYYLRWY